MFRGLLLEVLLKVGMFRTIDGPPTTHFVLMLSTNLD